MSVWDQWSYDWGEFWARRLDRQISDAEMGQGLKQVLVAYSAVERKRLIDEQDALERKLGGGS